MDRRKRKAQGGTRRHPECLQGSATSRSPPTAPYELGIAASDEGCTAAEAPAGKTKSMSVGVARAPGITSQMYLHTWPCPPDGLIHAPTPTRPAPAPSSSGCTLFVQCTNCARTRQQMASNRSRRRQPAASLSGSGACAKSDSGTQHYAVRYGIAAAAPALPSPSRLPSFSLLRPMSISQEMYPAPILSPRPGVQAHRRCSAWRISLCPSTLPTRFCRPTPP